MAVKFANLASSTLASSLSNSATSISVADASSFPTLGSGDYFYASIGEGSLSEIVKVTAVSSNTLTVVRGQDSTTARSHDSGTSVALRVVAAALDDIASQAQTAADTESVSIDGDTMTGALTISSSGTIGGATVANGYLKITDGTDTLGLDANEIMSTDRLFLNSADGEIFLRGNNSAGVKLFNGGTQFMSASRNLLNIGTISSGSITTSGTVTANSSSASTFYALQLSRSSSGIVTPDIWGTNGTFVIGTSSSVEALGFSGANATFYGTIDAAGRIKATNWIELESAGSGEASEEAGIRFDYNDSPLWYLYKDNANGAALHIQSAAVDSDGSPRVRFNRTVRETYIGGALAVNKYSVTSGYYLDVAGNIRMAGTEFRMQSSADSNLGLMIRDNTYATHEMDITSTRLGSGATTTLGLAGQNGINFYTAGVNALSISTSALATFEGNIQAEGNITINNIASDKKITFLRTGGKNISIEHDANQIYFWNNTDTNYMLKMSNAGLVTSKTGFAVNGTSFVDASLNLSNLGTISSGAITSTAAVQGNVLKAVSTGPTITLNDTDAANATNQVGYISFQRQGSEKAWLGYGSNGNADFSIRNTEGPITLLSNLESAYTISSGTITSSGTGTFEGGGNTLTLKKGTGTPAIAFAGTASDPQTTALIEGISGGGLKIYTSSGTISSPSWSPKITLAASGNVTIADGLTVTGNLTVNGTTTTINTSNLQVEDKNIVLNYSSGDSSSSANGAGITIQDAVNSTTDATILWDATNDEFDFSHTITLPEDKFIHFGTSAWKIGANGNDLNIFSSDDLNLYAGWQRFFYSNVEYARIGSSGGNWFTGDTEIKTGSVTLGTGYNLQWGSYGSGKPTISATGSALFFYPTGNVSGGNFRLYASMAEIRDGNALRFQREGNTAYGELTYDTGENITLHSSWGGKYLRLTRDGNLQLSGTTRIAHNGDATLGAISSGNITSSGNIGIGDTALAFGSGVSTLLLQGTAANNRAGAVYFREQDGTATSALYSTNGTDGYGTVLGAYQGSIKFGIGGIGSSNIALTIDTSKNATFTGNIGGASGHISGKFAVLSSSVHASYDFYNNGTTYLNGAAIIDDALSITGANSKLNLAGGSYEGSIVFGTNDTWHCGIRQHDDADAEMRIWHKNANGMIFLATGYDGEPASISRPTDGLAIQGNKLGIGNFSSVDPQAKLHVKHTGDFQLLLDGDTTSWAGIRFKDTTGQDDIWYAGNGDTFSIGGGGSIGITNKKLHVHGATTIGSGMKQLSMPTDGLRVQGNIEANSNLILGNGSSSGVLKLYTYDDAANHWDAYTWTDDTFRLNYNGAGSDEMVLNSDGDVEFLGEVKGDALVSTGNYVYVVDGNNYIYVDQSSGTNMSFGINGNTIAKVARVGSATGQMRVKQYSSGDTAAGYAAYAEEDDPNTGLYFPAADQVGLTVGGNPVVNVSTDGFRTDTGYGIYGNMQDEYHSDNAIRGGIFSADIANDTTALKIFAASQVDESSNVRAAGDYNSGIGFMHLDPNVFGSGYTGMQAWLGLRLHDTPGQERDFLTFATNNSYTAGTSPLERMCISPEGYIGIAQKDPQNAIHIGDGDGGRRVHIEANGGGGLFSATDVVNNNTNGFRWGHLNGTDRLEAAIGTTEIIDWRKTALYFKPNGTEVLAVGNDFVTINNPGGVVDFRVESDSEQHMLFVDGSENVVGIGRSDPAHALDVYKASPAGGVVARFQSAADSWIQLKGTTGRSYQIGATGSALRFYDDTTQRYMFDISSSASGPVNAHGYREGALTIVANTNYSGWVRVARSALATNGYGARGAFRVTVASTGGYLGPGEVSVSGFKNWSDLAAITKTEYASSQYFESARVTMDANYAYLELSLRGTLNVGGNSQFYVRVWNTGLYGDRWTPYSENLTAGLSSPTYTSDTRTWNDIAQGAVAVANIRMTSGADVYAKGTGWDDCLNIYSSDQTRYWNVLVDNGAGDSLRFATNQSGALVEVARFDYNQINLYKTIYAQYAEFNTGNDIQVRLRSPDNWAGIQFQDSNGLDQFYYNGQHSTFAIGGGGSNVSGKKLHVDGGMTVGASLDYTSNYTDGITVAGGIDSQNAIKINYVGNGNNGTDACIAVYHTSADWGLKIEKLISGTYYDYGIVNNGSGTYAYHQKNQGTETIRFNYNGNALFAGNVTAYASLSDVRLKEDIDTIPDALNKVCRLDGVTFNYKKDGVRSTGLLAQQLLEVLPEAVYKTEELDGDIEDQYYAINYGNTVGLLVEAIKELKQENDELKTMIAQIAQKLGD